MKKWAWILVGVLLVAGVCFVATRKPIASIDKDRAEKIVLSGWYVDDQEISLTQEESDTLIRLYRDSEFDGYQDPSNSGVTPLYRFYVYYPDGTRLKIREFSGKRYAVSLEDLKTREAGKVFYIASEELLAFSKKLVEKYSEQPFQM